MKKLQTLIIVASAIIMQAQAYASTGNASNSHVPAAHVTRPVTTSTSSAAK